MFDLRWNWVDMNDGARGLLCFVVSALRDCFALVNGLLAELGFYSFVLLAIAFTRWDCLKLCF